MDPALMVWIAVVAISGAGAVTIVYALMSAEPPTLELSKKEADREQMPAEAPSLASQIADSATIPNPEPIPDNRP